jgi:hypothetical protein
MDRARLIGSYIEVLEAIYDPKSYFERCLSLLRRLPGSPATSRGFKDARGALTNVRAFLLSLAAQTFSSYGFQYLRFLGRVLAEAPSLFPKAVEMAIFGHNLFKTTHRYVGKAWRDSRAAARSFARSEDLLRRLRARAAPEGFEALLAQLSEARSRLAAAARIGEGGTPIVAAAERALASLAASALDFAADRYRRLKDIARAADAELGRLYEQAIDAIAADIAALAASTASVAPA